MNKIQLSIIKTTQDEHPITKIKFGDKTSTLYYDANWDDIMDALTFMISDMDDEEGLTLEELNDVLPELQKVIESMETEDTPVTNYEEKPIKLDRDYFSPSQVDQFLADLTKSFEEPEPDPIVDRVTKRYYERSKKGIQKYNSTLYDEKITTLAGWLVHLQDELMDATLYIEKYLHKLNEDESNI